MKIEIDIPEKELLQHVRDYIKGLGERVSSPHDEPEEALIQANNDIAILLDLQKISVDAIRDLSDWIILPVAEELKRKKAAEEATTGV